MQLTFYISLVFFSILAVILCYIDILRLTEIHTLVNRNFSEQRAEIMSLQEQLRVAVESATRSDQTLRDTRDTTLGIA
jgi:hypothetical protein